MIIITTATKKYDNNTNYSNKNKKSSSRNHDENKLIHAIDGFYHTHPQPAQQQHRRRWGVRHRQGPRVQHRPAEAGVCGMPLSCTN